MNAQTRHKISISMKGRKKLATTKRKISEALKGKTKTKEHKENISKGMILWHEQNKNRK